MRRTTHAHRIGRASIGRPRVVLRVKLAAEPPRGRLRPDDQVVTLAAGDVIGSVALVAEMHHSAALHMLVPVRELALVAVVGAAHAAEGEPRATECLAEAYVERHVARVGVHIETEVLPMWRCMAVVVIAVVVVL